MTACLCLLYYKTLYHVHMIYFPYTIHDIYIYMMYIIYIYIYICIYIYLSIYLSLDISIYLSLYLSLSLFLSLSLSIYIYMECSLKKAGFCDILYMCYNIIQNLIMNGHHSFIIKATYRQLNFAKGWIIV